MNRDKEILSPEQELELIRKYVEGKATPEEQHLLEMRALEDPMLQDALEGYEAFPDALSATNGASPKGLSKLWLIVPVALLVAVVWFVQDKPTSPTASKKAPVPTPVFEEKTPTKAVIESHTTDSSVSIMVIETPEAKDLPDPSKTDAFVFRIEAPAPVAPQKPTPITTEDDEEIKSIRRMGAPIYHVYDYKLVDYRKIRIAYWDALDPVMGGTPASADGSDDRGNDLEPKTKRVAYVDFLQETMELFAEGKYPKSIDGFQEILKHFPDDANALFYGGLSALYTDQPEVALDLFTQSSNLMIATFSQESSFYAAQAAYEAGELEKAKAIWTRIASQDGFYKDQAKAKLKKYDL